MNPITATGKTGQEWKTADMWNLRQAFVAGACTEIEPSQCDVHNGLRPGTVGHLHLQAGS